MLYEGGEDHETLLDRFADLNSFLNLRITTDGTYIYVWEGGDLKYLCLKAGLSGNFATHDMCLWCLVSREDLSSLETSPARTTRTIRLSAHLPPLDEHGNAMWPFTCPNCDICFLNAEQHALESLTEA